MTFLSRPPRSQPAPRGAQRAPVPVPRGPGGPRYSPRGAHSGSRSPQPASHRKETPPGRECFRREPCPAPWHGACAAHGRRRGGGALPGFREGWGVAGTGRQAVQACGDAATSACSIRRDSEFSN